MKRLVTALLVAAASVGAQDSVKLADGSLIRGEVRTETDAEVSIITRMGELKTFPRKDVERVRRGRGLRREVRERLVRTDQSRAEELFLVAAWANENTSLRFDAWRLARRVLVIDPEHEGARDLLGHRKALGRWFPDEKAAEREVAKVMKARGLVPYSGGWAEPGDRADIRTSPEEWVLNEERQWCRSDDLMKERGLFEWEGMWYRPGERAFIAELKKLADRTGIRSHGAVEGPCRVICVAGRKKALENAKRLHESRRWFVKTFDAADTGLASGPESLHVVLKDEPQFVSFMNAYKDVHRQDDAYIRFCTPLRMMVWIPLNQVLHLGRADWENALVSGQGGGMMKQLWGGPGAPPDWLWIATSHHAEIAAFGQAIVWYVEPGNYEKSENIRSEYGRTVSGVKNDLRRLFKRRRPPSLRTLSKATVNTMTAELDTLGIAYLSFFLETMKREFLLYIKNTTIHRQDGRFERCFEFPPEAVDKKFHAWLGIL